MEQNTFEDALCILKTNKDKRIRRACWKEMVPSVSLLKPIKKPNDKMARMLPPRIFYQLKQNKDGSADRVPWLPNLLDLLADDWLII